MTIDEAIALQTDLLYHLREVGFNKYESSVRLSIEGLKREKANRKHPRYAFLPLMPGETEE